MSTWPEQLPQAIHQQSFVLTFPELASRTEMDTGKAYQRKRYTAAVRPFQGRIWVDETQLETFLNFYNNTLAQGTLPFDWYDPMTFIADADYAGPYLSLSFDNDLESYVVTEDKTTQIRFDTNRPYTVSAVSGSLYQISMNLEVLI